MAIKEVVELPGKIVEPLAGAIDNVIETGIKEDFEVRFSILGRDIGVRVEVMLLSKKPAPGAN